MSQLSTIPRSEDAYPIEQQTDRKTYSRSDLVFFALDARGSQNEPALTIVFEGNGDGVLALGARLGQETLQVPAIVRGTKRWAWYEGQVSQSESFHFGYPVE